MIHKSCFDLTRTTTCPNCRADIASPELIIHQKCTKYTALDRKVIIDAAEDGDDWAGVAAATNIPYQTAVSWIRSEQSTYVANATRSNFCPADLELFMSYVEEDNKITYKKLQEIAQTQLNKTFSVAAISRNLNGQCYTVNEFNKEPQMDLDTEEKQAKKKIFEDQLVEYMAAGEFSYQVNF